ncbi:hypothetical protein Ccr2_gp313 [Caulobacter phage Ccr2]|uniref:Uncharacterized protein n=5 Tax=Viruses TaxID=10239 RepID=K4JS52_9CAUD|nr:hypothetical protein D865_gp110 [Caulobacter phage phiCbK]ARB13844.1 hypothetical protein Ccr10_gp314 [Caulobacter phage Ccr10]ARB14189.1 hypothetical protein Ccr2_gp313 [Caulobacter phage Ccr2]ARB14883.1 hypothetical protein Ccr29_gp327 [Caulobacter phage Ccr29]ARB15221.1 hypothetical protein Ccr32_gp303 [Caulobacter phage Ccr32]ARB15555.1 hypothetical protein Ccr34_gp313 [Caulobacter phage Ccr34]
MKTRRVTRRQAEARAAYRVADAVGYLGPHRLLVEKVHGGWVLVDRLEGSYARREPQDFMTVTTEDLSEATRWTWRAIAEACAQCRLSLQAIAWDHLLRPVQYTLNKEPL